MRSLVLGAAACAAMLLFVPGEAAASWLQESTSRDGTEAREVDRGLVLGKGWVDLSLGFSWKRSTSGFTNGEGVFNVGEGSSAPWRNNAAFTYRNISLTAEWGFTRSSVVWFHVPIVWASLNNDLLDKPITSAGLGDVRFGWRNQWVSTEKPGFRTHFATDLWAKTPTGNESPGTYLGGPNNVNNLLTGTGTYDIGLELGLRQQLSVAALDIWAGYVLKPSAVVQWLIETESNQFNARIDPGDEVRLDIGVVATPVRPLSLRVDLKNTYRMASRVGTSTKGIPACGNCEKVPNTAGFWGDIRGTVEFWNVDFPLGFDVYFEYTLWGRNSKAFWPLESLSPSRGWTAGGNIFTRF